MHHRIFYSMVHNKLNIFNAMVRKSTINGGTNGKGSIASGKSADN